MDSRPEIVVLVAGGRRYRNEPFVHDALDSLDALFRIKRVVQGEAAGADTYAKNWALERAIEVISAPADWDVLGDAAGTIRNQEMLDTYMPDVVVGFPGGPGTRHMLKIARRAAIPTWEPNCEPITAFTDLWKKAAA